jgi:hypothetical protein
MGDVSLMHRYTVDGDNRVKVIAIIGVVSYVVMSVIYSTVIPIIRGVILEPSQTLPLLFTLITFGTIFAIFYELFNKCFWTSAPTSVSSIPNLRGKWEGCVSKNEEIDFNNYLQEPQDWLDREYTVPSELNIDQTWERIEFNYKRDQPNEDSKSVLAGVRDMKGSSPEVWYVFRNSGGMRTGEYYGLARLQFDKTEGGDEVLKGSFFTEPAGGFDGQAIFTRDSNGG